MVGGVVGGVVGGLVGWVLSVGSPVSGTCVAPGTATTFWGELGWAWAVRWQRVSSGPSMARASRSAPAGVKWMPSSVRTVSTFPPGPGSWAS